MDNNFPQTVVPPPAPTVPVTPQVEVQSVPPQGSSKKTVMIIVLVFVVVALLLAGGIYMYMRAQNSKPQESPETAQSTQELNNLSTDIDNVVIATPGAEFSTVDGELNSL